MTATWERVRPLVLFGWLVALVRFGIDATLKPERTNPAFYVGVDVLMPIAYLVVGVRGTFDDIRWWPKYPLMSFLLGLFVWGIPNAITYTTAQFLNWHHGRFHLPIAGTSMGKLLAGLKIGGGSILVGTVGSLVLMTLLIWLPGVVRRRRRAAA